MFRELTIMVPACGKGEHHPLRHSNTHTLLYSADQCSMLLTSRYGVQTATPNLHCCRARMSEGALGIHFSHYGRRLVLGRQIARSDFGEAFLSLLHAVRSGRRDRTVAATRDH